MNAASFVDGVDPRSQVEYRPSKRPRYPTHSRELCRTFYIKGRCRFGDDCIFAHVSSSQKRNELDWGKRDGDGMVGNQNVENEITLKKGVCWFFNTEAGCRYGEMCIFGHQGLEKSEEDQDMRSEGSVVFNTETVEFDEETNPWLKTRLCYSWMMHNNCRFGAACTFAHGQAELGRALHSLPSDSGNTRIAPRITKEDAFGFAYDDEGEHTVYEQKVQHRILLPKWKTFKKIVGIYADWIDEEHLDPCFATEPQI